MAHPQPHFKLSEFGMISLIDIQIKYRVDYIRNHLKQVVLAVQNDGCNAKGYSVWSLMDNFEWTLGYM